MRHTPALLIAVLLVPLAALHAADAPLKPNIIFILADDLGWGDLGCYGNLDIQTPRLNRMAQEGMLFEQFYVNASLCSPSRAAFLTGRFPARAGIHYWMSPSHNREMGMPDHLDPKTETLPRILQRGGYRTAHFGKWHLGQGKQAPVSAYGFNEVDYIWQGVGGSQSTPPNDPKGTEKLVDRGIQFAEACLRDKAPFYANLWLRDVHADLRPANPPLTDTGNTQAGAHRRRCRSITPRSPRWTRRSAAS